MVKRILLIEDDPWQADAIEEALQDRAKGAKIVLEVTWANSESQAREIIGLPDEHARFDCYIVDLMLPWSQDEKPPEPDDPRVLGPGGMDAGLRLVARIKDARVHDIGGRNAPPPIYLYSVVENAAVKGVINEHQRVYYLPKSESDLALASRVIPKLRD